MFIAGTEVDLNDVLSALAETRPIFHSEADFQLELAWHIRERDSNLAVRLESRPREWAARIAETGVKRPRLDIEVRSGEQRTALELKYLKRKNWSGEHGGQYFDLVSGVVDLSRYDVVKDISRIEKYIEVTPSSNGAVVVLAGDPAFWREPEAGGSESADSAFRIHHGATMTGDLGWGPTAGPGTTRGRDRLQIAGSYSLQWRGYSTEPIEHRALVVEVAPRERRAPCAVSVGGDASATSVETTPQACPAPRAASDPSRAGRGASSAGTCRRRVARRAPPRAGAAGRAS